MKTIGIIGGMGPLAAADLFTKITKFTAAKSDQEHVHVLVDSNTAIPDRTAAILSGGENPVPEMVRSALRLESMGADVLVMSCNTAHYFIDEVKKFTRLPMIHMLEETAAEAKQRNYSRVGLLATEGTCRTGIYDHAFAAQGVELIKPDDVMEEYVMHMIYQGIKAGLPQYPLDNIYKVLESMKIQGAECFILGCTELPLAFDLYGIKAMTIDPTEVLAKRAIEFVGGKVLAG